MCDNKWRKMWLLVTKWVQNASVKYVTTELKNKNQLDAIYYFIALLIGSACFGHLTSNLQQTKDRTTNVVINIIVASSWWWA